MPSLIKNLFNCSCKDNDDEEDEIKERITKLEMNVDSLQRENFQNMSRIEDKISLKFDLLNNKIDNVIMILNSKN